MKNRKVVVSFALLILLFSVISIGILAGFSQSLKVESKLSTGQISVSIEDGVTNKRATLSPADGKILMPGSALPYDLAVTNLGTSPAWVRVRLTWLTESSFDPTVISLDKNVDDWQEDGLWYYYKKPLEPGMTSERLISSFRLPNSIEQKMQGKSIELTMEAEAVQQVHNGNTVLDATGWSTP